MMRKILAPVAVCVFSLFTASSVLAEMVNINKADVAALDSLDGIGEKKAEAIVAYRTEYGEFKTLDDLKEVPGIGDKMFEKIKDDISLSEGITTLAEKPSKEDKAKKLEEKTENKADDKVGDKAEAGKKTDKVSDQSAPKADKS